MNNDSIHKILLLAANPIGSRYLRLGEEIREIEEGLKRSKNRERYSIATAQAVRYRDIRRAILEHEPQIIHFSGHGAGEEGLVFEDETGAAKLVDAEALAGLFQLFSEQVECVVLNACYSQAQAEAIAQHIPCVIGMKKAIGDRAAIEFAVGFYDALGAKKSYEFAYKLGCNAIRMAGIPEQDIPTFLQTAQIEPMFTKAQPPQLVSSGVSTTQFDVFLAHNTQDKPEVRAIALALKQRNIKSWIDEEQIAPGRSFQDEIQAAIPLVKSAAIFIGSQGLGRWQNWELKAFIAECVERKIPVIPVLLPGVNNLPEDLVFLKQLRWVTFSNGVNDESAINLLSWGITGEKPQSSKQLEQKPGKIPVIEQQLQDNLITLERREQFLRGLAQDIDQYLSRAIPSLNIPIIQIESKQTPDIVESLTFQNTPTILPIAFFEMLPGNEQIWEKSTSTNFHTLFEQYNGRVLLLGEPGSGKTITLMIFAKECIAKALKDVNQPLPLIAPIATWDAKASVSLTNWLSGLMPLLDKNQIEKVLHEGKALLLLDGLDELRNIIKNEETGAKIDIREKFLKIIPPNNKVLITCRSQEYQAIGSKARLNGAITLQPLNDEKIRVYLQNFPGLLSVIESDNVLKKLTRTPIILSLFTSAFEGLDHETRKLLNLNQGEVRDKILGTYIKRRFEVESRKIRSKIPFTLEQIYDVLGLEAMLDAGGGGNMNILHFENFTKHLVQRGVNKQTIIVRE